MPPAGLSRAGAVLLVSALPFVACGTSPRGAASPSARSGSPACGVDEVREYYCDDFLPLESSMPAPAPYETCPDSVANPPSEHEPPPRVGVFDKSYTEYTRRRAPPGHSCCYSWCSKVTLADPANPAAQAACHTGTAFREEYCMSELESGTQTPGPPPYDRCPQAIVPPKKAVFSVPEAALLDPALTSAHRTKGQPECCYAWCSQAPPGSGLLKSH